MIRRALLCAALTALAALATAPAASAQFGMESFDVSLTDLGGAPASLGAGEHPEEMTTTFRLNTYEDPDLGESPDQALKDLRIEQIPGLAGNAAAVPDCESSEFFVIIISAVTACPVASQVGLVDVEVVAADAHLQAPVYLLRPPPGVAAKLGFWATGLVSVTVDILVDPQAPHNLIARVHNVPQPVRFYGQELALWGNPADHDHDNERGLCIGTAELCEAGVAPKAFLTNPRSCTGPSATAWEISSWQSPEVTVAGSVLTHDEADAPQGFAGCDSLGFDPAAAAAPSTDLTESPSGLDFSIDFEDPGLTDPAQAAQADLRKAVVTLPEGISINPAAAGGQGACGEAELAKESYGSPFGAGCPADSRLAAVTLTTPLLREELSGSIFLAEPYENPFGSLLAAYLVIKQPERGVIFKLPGKIDTDPHSGQITASFDENPPYPFTRLEVSFPPGPRAALITPPTCGTYEIATDLYPSSGNAALRRTSAFELTRSPAGGECPSDPSALPNSPSFDAGTASPISKRPSPFLVRLGREDASQRFSALQLSPPEGLIATLAGTESCPEAALAAAASKSGREEQASPSCPASSRIGVSYAAAGAGPAPYWTRGEVYLTPPYKGAPLSLAAIVPAVAGPFDLGTVVVRAPVRVDPESARVSATTDPLPTALSGIPLDLKTIEIALDRPGFTRTGTSCDPAAVEGLLSTTLAQSVSLFSRYQLSDCARLAFKPKISLFLRGGTRRGAHPALTVVLKTRPGDAHISFLQLAMPRSEFLENAHIRTICTRVRFAAEACPPDAAYGKAVVRTPLLDYPLRGKVWLRSSDNTLPDVVPDLRGPASQPLRIESAGRTDSIRGGIRNTFSFVPDAPFSKLVTRLQGGRKGLLVNSRDLCKRTYRATVRYAAHNGRTYTERPKLRVKCKGKRGKRHHRRHRRLAR